MTYSEALRALDALYATLPRLECRRQCQESCGVVVMSRVEWLRITKQLGFAPKGKPSLVCPMLKNGECIVHDIKPMICRLYGLMQDPRMLCPHGCRPERYLSDAEGYALLQTAEEITQALFPDMAPSKASEHYALKHKQGEQTARNLQRLIDLERRKAGL